MRNFPAVWLLTFACLGTTAMRAAELELRGWHTDVNTAWQTAQAQRRPLLVFVTRDNCLFCVKMKRGTLVDQRVARAIAAGYVPLVLDATQPSPLATELDVKAFPALFVISTQAVVLDRIDGYVAADALSNRLTLLDRQAARGGARSQ